MHDTAGQPTPDELRSRLERAYHLAPDDAATEAIAIALAARAAGEAAAEPWADVNTAARRVLEDLCCETGRTKFKTPAGEAFIPSPSVRVSYDTKALDALVASNADLARVLTPHRRETHSVGALTIRGGR